jgi:hypothetical protein
MCYNPVESEEVLMSKQLASHLKGVGIMNTKLTLIPEAEALPEHVVGSNVKRVVGVVVEVERVGGAFEEVVIRNADIVRVVEEVVVTKFGGVQVVGHMDEDLNFGTPEQLIQDEQAWREKVASTTPEQLAGLEAMFMEEERKGTTPLDFSGR